MLERPSLKNERKYKQSEHGKAVAKAYQQSARGRAVKIAWRKKYGRHETVEQKQNYQLTKNYGKGAPEHYRAQIAAQSNLCAVCHKPETLLLDGKVKALGQDHDHATGKLRGALCSNCNNGLGRFKDDAAILASAIQYLANWG